MYYLLVQNQQHHQPHQQHINLSAYAPSTNSHYNSTAHNNPLPTEGGYDQNHPLQPASRQTHFKSKSQGKAVHQSYSQLKQQSLSHTNNHKPNKSNPVNKQQQRTHEKDFQNNQNKDKKQSSTTTLSEYNCITCNIQFDTEISNNNHIKSHIKCRECNFYGIPKIVNGIVVYMVNILVMVLKQLQFLYLVVKYKNIKYVRVSVIIQMI